MLEYHAAYYQVEDGWYMAQVLDFPGVVTQVGDGGVVRLAPGLLVVLLAVLLEGGVEVRDIDLLAVHGAQHAGRVLPAVVGPGAEHEVEPDQEGEHGPAGHQDVDQILALAVTKNPKHSADLQQKG